jgi:hypothetical protein
MAQVFPHGSHLMPDSIAEAQDYDEQTRTRTPSGDCAANGSVALSVVTFRSLS